MHRACLTTANRETFYLGITAVLQVLAMEGGHGNTLLLPAIRAPVSLRIQHNFTPSSYPKYPHIYNTSDLLENEPLENIFF